MPVCMALGEQAQVWQCRLEDQGEDWRCIPLQDADTAYKFCTEQRIALAVVDGSGEGERFLQKLRMRPPLSPPWLMTEIPCPWADGQMVSMDAAAMAAWWRSRERTGMMPKLALVRHEQLLCLARGLMTTLNVPEHLKAWTFLADMMALTAVHPSLAEDLQGRLYPLIARRHGLSAAAVERRLRLAIEATWSAASLGALERFFGQSVDPERGKPTNREFLYRVQERLLLAGRRFL